MSADLYPDKQLMRYRAVSIGLAVFAFCLGAAAFFGWILNNPYLKRIHPSLVTMKANTAVCLMLVGVSCVLINDRSQSHIKRGLIKLFAAIVGFVGLITLSELVVGWSTGLEQFLFHEWAAERGLSLPGRMGVPATLNCPSLRSAVLFLGAKARRCF